MKLVPPCLRSSKITLLRDKNLFSTKQTRTASLLIVVPHPCQIGEKMNKIVCVITLLLAINCSTANADAMSSDTNLQESKCNAGGAIDQFQCIEKKLAPLEQQMNQLLDNAIEKTKSMWGAKATDELKQRIKSSQSNWLQYRDDLCMRNYYKKAPVHPPSLSLEISGCKYKKTEERIEEIRDAYLTN